MAHEPVRYLSDDEDSARWAGFAFRDGDIVISTRSKTGTTWVQMICALLIFQAPELPVPLGQISPWLDRVIYPRDEVFSRLAGQALRDWLLDWVDHDASPREEMDSLAGVMWHLSDAWARRGEPNVLLIHYDDLSADLDGQMRRLAGRLGISVPEQAWPSLVQAATFEHMRASAEQIIGASQILKSSAAFFRRGTSGAGRDVLTDQEIAHYHARTSRMAPPDMLTWLHSPHCSRPI